MTNIRSNLIVGIYISRVGKSEASQIKVMTQCNPILSFGRVGDTLLWKGLRFARGTDSTLPSLGCPSLFHALDAC